MRANEASQSVGSLGWTLGILGLALLVCLLGCCSYAGGWNDGSRLATVESLVDQQTLVIDNSIFVRPANSGTSPLSPYPEGHQLLRERGTLDKLFIKGHYYSDKSPVPAVLLALCYTMWQKGTGWTAAQNPRAFCYFMTLASSGVAYLLAVWFCWHLAGALQVPLRWRVLLVLSLALASMAPSYVRHVNNHILLLGVTAGVMLGVVRLRETLAAGRAPTAWLLCLGCLSGLSYSIDLGVGPLLLVCCLALVAWRCWSFRAVGMFILAALPWVFLHHILNYVVGGTFGPANAVADYFTWPNSPFNARNLTGGWTHPHLGKCLIYLADLLVGKKGFLGHNLPLYLALPGTVWLLTRRREDRPEILFAAAVCVSVWLLYGVASNNYSGECCSIRWFLPLLAPGYYLLALLLRDLPSSRPIFLLLTTASLPFGLWMYWRGPWSGRMIPQYWTVQIVLVVVLGIYSWRRRDVLVAAWQQQADLSWLPGVGIAWAMLARDNEHHEHRLQPTPAAHTGSTSEETSARGSAF